MRAILNVHAGLIWPASRKFQTPILKHSKEKTLSRSERDSSSIMKLRFNVTQDRRQDAAVWGAKNQKGGHIFTIQYWMYAATGGPNVKWGGRAPLAPPLATALT